MNGQAIFEEDKSQASAQADEEIIQINVPRSQAVMIMNGDEVVGVLATNKPMKGWERKHLSDHILKKLIKGK